MRNVSTRTPSSSNLYGSTPPSPVPQLYSLSNDFYGSPALSHAHYRSTYSSVTLTPSSVVPTPSSVAPTPSSVALRRSTPSNVDRADHTNTYSNVSYPNPSDDAPDVSTTLCGWVDEHGSVCGEPITYDCVTHLATAHGISKTSPRTRLNCRWCSPPRHMKRDSMLRHVREIHLGWKRRRISENRWANTTAQVQMGVNTSSARTPAPSKTPDTTPSTVSLTSRSLLHSAPYPHTRGRLTSRDQVVPHT